MRLTPLMGSSSILSEMAPKAQPGTNVRRRLRQRQY